MNHPDDDLLAALALGDDTAPADAAAHARSCPTCSATIAALHRARTTLRAPVPELAAPPAWLWDAVQAEIDDVPVSVPVSAQGAAPGAAQGPAAHPAPSHALTPAPDELAERRAARAQRRRIPLGWVAGAAAAGLVIGVAGTRVLGDGGQDDPGAVTVASTELDTLDTQQVKGSAEVVRHDGVLDLAVSTEPIDPEDGYLEVWLINEDLQRMVSVGVLRPGEADQSFAIPQELLDQGYVIVDISREGFDSAPEHSGDSVVRGTLPT